MRQGQIFNPRFSFSSLKIDVGCNFWLSWLGFLELYFDNDPASF